jgi:hypothetical protein
MGGFPALGWSAVSAQLIPFPKREASTFEEAWALRAGQMKKRGSGREKTAKLWNKAAARVGQKELLGALRRYLREEKEPTYGYPGLSVWLNDERWDHWLVSEVTSSADNIDKLPKFAEPYRSRLVELCGEPWVRSYIDRCELDGSVLVVANSFSAGRIREKAREMKAAGLTALRLHKG